jgi:CRP-like cAMP-binding protein
VRIGLPPTFSGRGSSISDPSCSPRIGACDGLGSVELRRRWNKELTERLKTVPLFSGCSSSSTVRQGGVGGRTRRRLGPGSFFGEISLLDRGPRTATVVAETPVRALSLSAWNFRAALKEHPSLAVKMLKELASRVRTANPSVSD